MSATSWHCLSHTWFPHFNARSQARPHEAGCEFQQGHNVFSCPPKQSTGTFMSHGGCGSFWISNFSTGKSHGPAGLKFLSIICTLTASWHFAGQGWSQPVTLLDSKQGWTHTGQSPIWHLCAFGWWHFDENLQGCEHFGGFVFFSRPHETLIDVLPHLQMLGRKNNWEIAVYEIYYVIDFTGIWLAPLLCRDNRAHCGRERCIYVFRRIKFSHIFYRMAGTGYRNTRNRNIEASSLIHSSIFIKREWIHTFRLQACLLQSRVLLHLVSHE